MKNIDSSINLLKILVVDDSPNTLEVISRNLAEYHYKTFTVNSVADAIAVLKNTDISIIITDYKMPKHNGMELLEYANGNHPKIETIMVTGYATIDSAIEAVRKGVHEYITKPFTNEELITAVKNAELRIQERLLVNSSASSNQKNFWGMIGHSSKMQVLFQSIKKATILNATVLITGESGTGKELVARATHYGGPRSASPFVPINCAGIPENLFESELFGHVRGAFTGATESRLGFFQTADGGTIFLDEIGELPLPMQAKLLRVLQEKEVYMLGQKKAQKVDVRVIAATNKDLKTLVDQKQFREDLYYRLNVITIEIPPLRERKDDILILSKYFIDKYSKEMGKTSPLLSDDALVLIKNYSWPGNVRELENTIQKCLIMDEDEIITSKDLPSYMKVSRGWDFADLQKTLIEVETEYIRKVLDSVNDNKSKAANILGIDRKTLREKIQKQQLH
ncbi:MAG: sigma-54-dependent Fis family transcriptional regulator [Oligoflexia bacterium]|nr:sigma-54-dependent Fis family transcriptional regulator [Oligoflexia bacterium]